MNSSDRIDRLLRKRACRRSRAMMAIVLASSACLATPTWAQYGMSWYTVDGGGRVSSGGIFEIVGSIGQPDAGLMRGGVYSFGGGFWAGSSGTVDVSEEPPVAFRLGLPSPNPLVQRSIMSFELPQAAEVDLVVYDVAGRVMQTLAAGRFPAGRHERAWDGTDTRGRPVAPGVYFVRFAAGPYQAHRRILVLH